MHGPGMCLNCLFQLHVRDIHLRYEDDVSVPGHSFAFGVTINNISAESADSGWVCWISSCS